jgi:hypothetical protein
VYHVSSSALAFCNPRADGHICYTMLRSEVARCRTGTDGPKPERARAVSPKLRSSEGGVF